MKTPLEKRGSRANDSRSARLGKTQPDGTHGQRIAHLPCICPARQSGPPGELAGGDEAVARALLTER